MQPPATPIEQGLRELATASLALAELRREASRASQTRDRLIRELVEAGCSYQQIAEAGQITKGRVAHIVADRR